MTEEEQIEAAAEAAHNEVKRIVSELGGKVPLGPIAASNHRVVRAAIQAYLSTPPSVSAREIAEGIVRVLFTSYDGLEVSRRVPTPEETTDAIASAIAPFEEQIREKDREIANLTLANEEASKTIDRAHRTISELDPQFTAGSG